jgi:hypothetical protein
MLSSILRVAESLDRSHTQAISGLDLRDRGKDVLIQVHTSADAELEVWATNRHLKPFEKLVGKPVHLEATGVAAAAAVPDRVQAVGEKRASGHARGNGRSRPRQPVVSPRQPAPGGGRYQERRT